MEPADLATSEILAIAFSNNVEMLNLLNWVS